MKGLVFREFLTLVEEKWSLDMVDEIIEDANVSSGGAYTSVGNYPHDEIVALVLSLAKKSGIAVVDLIKIFGQHLFARFAKLYPQFFFPNDNTFVFITRLDEVIHAEVKKLYSDAETPKFLINIKDNVAELTYISTRPFPDLAEGLILGCIEYFQENITLKRITPEAKNENAQAKFILEKYN